MNTPDDFASRRLHNQKLLRPVSQKPEAIVAWLGAVQSQDYAGARWALGQRVLGATDGSVAEAFDAGRILRTHVLRPTWHFVSPRDIRWLLALSAPRVNAANASYYRKLELDARLFARTGRVLERELQGRRPRTRAELAAALTRSGIPAVAGMRLAYIVMKAELDGLVCSGPLRGKEITYALLEERVPPAPPRAPTEALSELTRRYFVSRGPATLRDYVWWSGLTVQQAREGLELTRGALAEEVLLGRIHWFDAQAAQRKLRFRSPLVRLLPNYDELLIAYKDRESARDPKLPTGPRAFDEYGHFLTIDGRLRGTWRGVSERAAVRVAVQAWRPLGREEKSALTREAARYGKFLDRPVTVSFG